MFCAVTWSIFHVGWKVRWVSESKFCGLSNGYEKFLCTCSRSQENGKKKVGPIIWDTLYERGPSSVQGNLQITFRCSSIHFCFRGSFPSSKYPWMDQSGRQCPWPSKDSSPSSILGSGESRQVSNYRRSVSPVKEAPSSDVCVDWWREWS